MQTDWLGGCISANSICLCIHAKNIYRVSTECQGLVSLINEEEGVGEEDVTTPCDNCKAIKPCQKTDRFENGTWLPKPQKGAYLPQSDGLFLQVL